MDMTHTENLLKVAILTMPESTASTVMGLYDLFASTGRDWPMVTRGEPGTSLVQPVIVSADGEAFRTGNNALLQPDACLHECTNPDIICIPDLMVMPGEDIGGRFTTEQEWLVKQYSAGTTIATACSGALLLAECGLLDNQEATTHWAYCDAMRRTYPEIRLLPDQSLVTSGQENRLVMAGGGTTWLDLALMLVARFIGTEEAMRLARLYLIEWHHIGQRPFANMALPRNRDDAVIERCQLWAADHYSDESPVASMAKLSGLTVRSFTRRFKNATGLSPLEYIHTLRLEEAKYMLETSDSSIESIANDVGYEDSSFFSRLFRRKVGMTPARYRRRFGELRRTFEKENAR